MREREGFTREEREFYCVRDRDLHVRKENSIACERGGKREKRRKRRGEKDRISSSPIHASARQCKGERRERRKEGEDEISSSSLCVHVHT